MSTLYTDTELPHALVQIGRLCDAVRTEFDLIGVRMTWLVTSQAFMFAAFATCVSNLKTGGQGSADLILSTTIRYLLVLLPILGMTVSAIVAVAIRAAHIAMIRLKKDRDDLIKKLPDYLYIELVSSRDPEHGKGNIPPTYIPWIICTAWAGAALSLPMPPW